MLVGFRVWRGPDGVLVRDDRGHWFLLARRPGTGVAHAVVGLPDAPTGFPALPTDGFATGGLLVSLSGGLTIAYEDDSLPRVLVVTDRGRHEGPRAPSDEELADVVRRVEAKQLTVRAAASLLVAGPGSAPASGPTLPPRASPGPR